MEEFSAEVRRRRDVRVRRLERRKRIISYGGVLVACLCLFFGIRGFIGLDESRAPDGFDDYDGVMDSDGPLADSEAEVTMPDVVYGELYTPDDVSYAVLSIDGDVMTLTAEYYTNRMWHIMRDYSYCCDVVDGSDVKPSTAEHCVLTLVGYDGKGEKWYVHGEALEMVRLYVVGL